MEFEFLKSHPDLPGTNELKWLLQEIVPVTAYRMWSYLMVDWLQITAIHSSGAKALNWKQFVNNYPKHVTYFTI